MANRVGQQLDNYRLVRLQGAGGFGEVYLAEHIYRTTQPPVAIKILPPLAQDDLRSFLTEARTFRLKHPNIVQVLDFGVEGRIPFIVMEYAPNGTLRQRHPKGTRVPLPIIVSYVKQVASALQYAHDERLVHRDVKPENMLLGVQNRVLLSDFGIATIAHGTSSQSGETMAGTIPYMAPEQIQAHPRAASDQYSLGVVVYEWLCGDRPFQGTLTEVAVKHATLPPPPLHEKAPTISPDVEQVVMTALAKDPKQRYGSVQAFATALEQAAQGTQKTAAPPRKAAAPTPRGSDLQTVLAISTTEAQTGTNRTLNLPGGRKVTVSMPAGVQDGQVVRLDGQGEPTSAGGEAGALILTIKVEAVEGVLPPVASNAAMAELTVLATNTGGPETSAPTVRSTSHQATESKVDPPERVTQENPLAGPTQAIISPQRVLPTEVPIPPHSTSQPQEAIASPSQSAQPSLSEKQDRQQDLLTGETPPPDDHLPTTGREKCPVCATKNGPEEEFCISCGFSLYQGSKPTKTATPPSLLKQPPKETVPPALLLQQQGVAKRSQAEDPWTVRRVLHVIGVVGGLVGVGGGILGLLVCVVLAVFGHVPNAWYWGVAFGAFFVGGLLANLIDKRREAT